MSDAMPIYVGDYIADTMHLSARDHGAYLLILMAMHRAGGSLAYDEKRLAKIARVSSSRWASIKDTILEFFVVKNGVLVHGHSRAHAVRRERTPLPPSTRDAVYERDGPICAYCDTTEGPFEIDHIHPVSRGGTNDPDNLTVACATCNRSKRDKPIWEWMQ